MSGSTPPGSPPPEVPEEFAAAYRAAYEQALAAQTGGPQHRVDREPDEPEPDEPEPDDEADDADDGEGAWEDDEELPRRRGPLIVGTHRSEQGYSDDPTWFERVRDSTWFVPILLAMLAMLLVLGAYAVGRRFAGQVGDESPSAEPSLVIGAGGKTAKQLVTNQRPGEGAWDGKVVRIANVRAKVGCTSRSGLDASGERVTYVAGNLTDGVADTTWRCDGAAIGEKITLDLGDEVDVGQVGLVPGYAKTDEQSRADRYAENNRVTRVRWTIGDTVLVQRMSGAPDDRSLRLLRVPKTSTDTVELEILAVAKGPRDTTAISEIVLGRAG
ncbi:MAG: hypothetical protein JWR85_2033 [Marmoricola sp.]|nr:hypothetical protein [Marmoricola sp.]